MSENCELTEQTTAPHLLTVAGVGMAALLALSACTSMETADGDAEEDGQDQGQTTDGEDEETPDQEEQDEEDLAEDIPTLEEVTEASLDAVEEAESVTFTVEGTDEELGGHFEEATMGIFDEEVEISATSVHGFQDDISQTLIEVEDGTEFEFLRHDEAVYVTGESMIEALEVSGEDSNVSDMDDLADELVDHWLETALDNADDFSALGFLETLEVEEIDGGRELWTLPDDAEIEGELTEFEGQDAWVYELQDGELYVAADAEQPLPLGVISEVSGGEFEAAFTDWDESDLPEAPEDDEIISEEEMMEIIEEYEA